MKKVKMILYVGIFMSLSTPGPRITKRRFWVSPAVPLLVYCILPLVAFFPSGCSQSEKATQILSIEDVIVRYDRGISNAARTGDMKSLEGLATEEVLRKLYFWIAAWHDADSYMDALMNDISFTTVEISGHTAKAVTREHWSYTYRSLKDRTIVSPASVTSYELEFTLQNNKQTWVITGIRILSQKGGT